jgi:hypothetical protein
MELRQTEHGLGEHRRRGVILVVPDRVLGSVLQPEVSAHVNDASATGQPGLGLAGANVMRQAAEHDIDAVQLRLGAEYASQVEQGKNRGQGLAGKRARSELGQLHTWVASQEMDKGHPGVTIGPGDGRFYRLSHERMSIQANCINIRPKTG